MNVDFVELRTDTRAGRALVDYLAKRRRVGQGETMLVSGTGKLWACCALCLVLSATATVLAAAAAFHSPPDPGNGVLRAKRFVLCGDDGAIMGALFVDGDGAAKLSLGQEGSERLVFSADSKRARIRIRDGEHDALSSRDNATMLLFSDDTTPRIAVDVPGKGCSTTLRDTTGAARVSFGVHGTTPTLCVFDQAEKTRAVLVSHPEHTFGVIIGADGKQVWKTP